MPLVPATANTEPLTPRRPRLGLIKPLEIRLANASCFDFLASLPTGCVDLVLIDPPYEISRETGFSSVGEHGVPRLGVNMDFGRWDYHFIGLSDVIKEAHRVLRTGGTFVCFYDLWKLSQLKELMDDAKFKQLRFIEWLKTNPVPINSKINYLTNSREIALLGVKGGKPTFNARYHRGVYEFPICHEKGRFHPTQKPLPLFRALIETHSRPGDLVLDCFSGSGTTAHAAMETGRRFIGCELDPQFHSQSIDRLRHAAADRPADFALFKE